MINDVKKLETEGHIIKVKAHMTLLEEEQKQFEELPNVLEDMDVEEGKKVEKTVPFLYFRTLCSIFCTTTMRTSARVRQPELSQTSLRMQS
jgi:hypothetical protein